MPWVIEMCGFLYSTFLLSDEEIAKSEKHVSRRGPDYKRVKRIDGETFVHYLLHITGESTPQPIVRDELALVYNGEVYNFRKFGNFLSDGHAVLEAYKSAGIEGLRELDGEYSGVIRDFSNRKIVIFRDVFGTKPIFFAMDARGICIASYPSQLIELGYTSPMKLPSNKIVVLDDQTENIRDTIYEYKRFSLSQSKSNFDDWHEAFYRAIEKRTSNECVKYFIGLSSGYDSGLISATLNKLSIPYRSYSIVAAEDRHVLEQRIQLTPHNALINLTKSEYDNQQAYLRENCEPWASPPRATRINGYILFNDKGAVGTGIVCEHATRDGCRVYISGQGSDEILSDYGYAGVPAPGFLHCTIAGNFPSDLSKVFPWENFYGGTQEEFLAKDEFVGGSYGLEVRYPFLDFDVVQEFLWLKSDLKNQAYKAPVESMLKELKYPFASGGVNSKVGFRANSNLVNA